MDFCKRVGSGHPGETCSIHPKCRISLGMEAVGSSGNYGNQPDKNRQIIIG
jgi:hypothetical protein